MLLTRLAIVLRFCFGADAGFFTVLTWCILLYDSQLLFKALFPKLLFLRCHFRFPPYEK